VKLLIPVFSSALHPMNRVKQLVHRMNALIGTLSLSVKCEFAIPDSRNRIVRDPDLGICFMATGGSERSALRYLQSGKEGREEIKFSSQF